MQVAGCHLQSFLGRCRPGVACGAQESAFMKSQLLIMMLVSGLHFGNHWSKYSTQNPEWFSPATFSLGYPMSVQGPARLSMIWLTCHVYSHLTSTKITILLTQNSLPTNPRMACSLPSFSSLLREAFHKPSYLKVPLLHPQSLHHALSTSLP